VDPNHFILEVLESSIGAGETYTISPAADMRFPKAGRVFRVSSQLTGGSANTVTPQLSTSTTFTPPYLIVKTSPAEAPDESQTHGIPYGLPGESIYHRSDPNDGSDSSVVTRYLIKKGWEQRR